MRLRIAPISVDGAQLVASQAFASSKPSTEKPRSKDLVVLQSPFKSGKLLRSQTYSKPFTRLQTIRRSCSANLDEGFAKYQKEGFAKRFSFSENEQVSNPRWSSVTSQLVTTEDNRRALSLPTKFDILEPKMLRLKHEPEQPDWFDKDSSTYIIEQKAKSFDLPVSLRMIKKKQQLQRGFKDFKDSDSCSVIKAVSSMVYILVELQTHALQMRDVVRDEELEIIVSEIKSSFSWLFQQVFSQTPTLMIDTMSLIANYSIYSTTNSVLITEEENKLMDPIKEAPQIGDLKNITEMILWNSIVDEATELRGVDLEHDVVQNFVSPVSVEIEQDDYTEFHRTDLLYQVGLSNDPNNPLLLLNYAQFLCIVTHDYDRAEECFKRAIEVDPTDGELLSHYAHFLWKIKKDLWGAEETYLQAADTEPNNPGYASRYAHFLWDTGASDTCYPLDDNCLESETT